MREGSLIMSEKLGFLGRLRAYMRQNKIGDILVLRGLLSTSELHKHLKAHKGQSQRFGQYLIEKKVISRRQLAFSLAAQTGIRTTAAGLAVFASVSVFAPKSARAGSIKDIPGNIILASAGSGAGQIGRLQSKPRLFGSTEKASSDISAFTKWSDMFSKFERDVNTTNGHNVLSKWKNDLASLKGQPLKQMAASVNTMINKTRYVSDNRNWGKSDYWATPVEFFTKGGDCEDYAIAKYASLRALGVPESRMRVAIVQDMVKNIPHAILVVYGDDGAYILDNQSEAMKYADNIKKYKPIFSINRTGWWLHKAPTTGGTVLASAAN